MFVEAGDRKQFLLTVLLAVCVLLVVWLRK